MALLASRAKVRSVERALRIRPAVARRLDEIVPPLGTVQWATGGSDHCIRQALVDSDGIRTYKPDIGVRDAGCIQAAIDFKTESLADLMAAAEAIIREPL